jgi:hypothetical protein
MKTPQASCTQIHFHEECEVEKCEVEEDCELGEQFGKTLIAKGTKRSDNHHRTMRVDGPMTIINFSINWNSYLNLWY